MSSLGVPGARVRPSPSAAAAARPAQARPRVLPSAPRTQRAHGPQGRAGVATRAEGLNRQPWPGTVRKLDYNKTYYPKGADADVQNKVWYVIDAEGQTLGRLAVLAANYLRGKHLPSFQNSMDMGGYVVVINADKVAVTGKKETDKMYYYHRVHRPGTMKTESLADLRKRIPERIVERAVWGMIPKGRMGRNLFTHLKVYAGASHPHEAQKPLDVTHLIDKKPSEADMSGVMEAHGVQV